MLTNVLNKRPNRPTRLNFWKLSFSEPCAHSIKCQGQKDKGQEGQGQEDQEVQGQDTALCTYCCITTTVYVNKLWLFLYFPLFNIARNAQAL